MSPLISILIPAFNAERWIAQSIESALKQSWARKEVIVVDDGSTDRTREVAHQFASHGVFVIRQTNHGAAAARNTAFEASKGDYIQWLDADDVLDEEKIALQMTVLRRSADTRVLASSAWAQFLGRPQRSCAHETPLWSDLLPLEWLYRKMEQNLYMPNAGWLVSRDLTEMAGPWNKSLSFDDDGEYFTRVILASHEIKFVRDAWAFYRMPGLGNVSFIGALSPKKLESCLLSMQLTIAHLMASDGGERMRSACLRYLEGGLFWLYPDRPDLVEELQTLALTLGGRLEIPPLRRKYAWIERATNRRLAKRAQCYAPMIKVYLLSWLEDFAAHWRRSKRR